MCVVILGLENEPFCLPLLCKEGLLFRGKHDYKLLITARYRNPFSQNEARANDGQPSSEKNHPQAHQTTLLKPFFEV